MTAPARSTFILLFSALALCAPVSAQPLTTGVDLGDLEDLTYLSATTSTRKQAKRIKDGLGARLEGSTRTRRVTFEFEDGDAQKTMDVRGILFGWDNLEVERYRLADLEEAVIFANHDREDTHEERYIEARGRQVLVISGEDADDAQLIAEVRKLAWPRNAQKRIDAMAYRRGLDHDYMVLSDEARNASPYVVQFMDQFRNMLEGTAANDPTAKLTKSGDDLRLDYDGTIFVLTPNTIGIFEDEASEAAVVSLLQTVDAGFIPTPPGAASSAGGMTSALGGVASSGAAPVPATLDAADSGKTFKAQVGDRFVVRLGGNSSTGYFWDVVSGTPGLTLVAEETDSVPGGPVGGGSVFSFRFKASKPGKHELELHYARSSGAPAKVFSATVVVE